MERYEKRTPTKKNGKATPQQQWMNLIECSTETAPAHLKEYLQIMAGLDNVPRKEKQFRNFTTNSLNLRGKRNSEKVVTDIWSYLKGLRQKQLEERATAEAKENESSSKEGDLLEHLPKEPVPSSKEEVRSQSDGKRAETKKSFDRKTVKKAMKKVLKKAKDNTLSLKLLRKAVQDHLGIPKSARSQVKELVQLNVKSSKKRIFYAEGKTVTLKLD